MGTSAIMIRRRAFAKDTSTPISSKQSSLREGLARGRMENGVDLGLGVFSQRMAEGVTA